MESGITIDFVTFKRVKNIDELKLYFNPKITPSQ